MSRVRMTGVAGRSWRQASAYRTRCSSAHPDHGVEQGFGDPSRGHGLLPDGDHDRLLIGCGRCLDIRRIALHENEQAALGAGMFERDRHHGFDQPLENNLCGNSLRGFHHRPDV
jgi:hypothetical protein